MGYKREHLRIPIQGKATLSSRQLGRVKAQAVDISTGGIGLAGSPAEAQDSEYHVEVSMPSGRNIQLLARVAYRKENLTGLKTLFIDKQNLRTIDDIISEFQTSESFIDFVDRQDILNDWFNDEKGRKLDFLFEKPQK